MNFSLKIIKENKELKKNDSIYRLMIESIKDYAIFILDPKGNIASWNAGAENLKGYSEKEIIGKHFSIFYTKEAKEENYPAYELSEATKHGRFEDEGWRVKKDGSQFYANVIITALFNSKKKLIGFSKITRDLTEKKKIEDNLFRTNAELEKRVKERTEELSKNIFQLKKINADLDNFIYTASHDLKAPVSNIEGLIHTLCDSLKENNIVNPEIFELITMINESVSRFQGTIRDLTEINQSQRNEKEDIAKLNLDEVIKNIMLSIPHLLKESNAIINIDVSRSPEILFSKIHIKSIIYNLLVNAIKYRSNERRLIIDLNAYTSDQYYIIELKDNGLGIKEEHQDKIFQMFKRMHSHVDGSGIGLYLVKRIIDNSEGKIEVESKEGQGSVFRVFLPKPTE